MFIYLSVIFESSGQAVECIDWRFELYCNTLLNKIHYHWFNRTTSFVLAGIKLLFELYLHYSKRGASETDIFSNCSFTIKMYMQLEYIRYCCNNC